MTAAIGHLLQLPASFIDQATPLSQLSTQHQGDVGGGPQHITDTSPEGNSIRTPEAAAAAPSAAEVLPTCITCGIGSDQAFGSAAEQREHFRSDWHRLNVRRRAAGRAALSEEEFERHVQEDAEVSSISGSDSDSEDEQPSVSGRQARSRSGQVLFRSSEGKPFAVWRCLLVSEVDNRAPLTDGQLLHSLQQVARSTQTWVVIMSKAGHFAAAVFDLRPRPGKQQGRGEQPLFETLAHKTFHRYVVRAKAGGRQSAQDATGKFAKSAGSRIRRYNEAALEKEITETLTAWKSHLHAADLVFLQASGVNARPICHGDSPLVNRADPRVRSIPFNTRRPTLSETQRVVKTLLCVFEPSNAAMEAASASTQAVKSPRPQQPKPVAAVMGAAAATDRAAAQAEAEAQALAKRQAEERDTPLHKAARAGNGDRIWALLESGQDPTAQDVKGRTPYAVASEKAARDTFRRFMAHEPDKWDYAAAGVPSALTEEMEVQQQAKQAEKKARQREKEKDRKKAAAERKAKTQAEARVAAQAEVVQAAAEAATLSNMSKSSKAQQKGPALSRSELEQKKRREQMAAAAEARMVKLKASAQQNQLWQQQ